MPSFDIISEIDEVELRNAVANATREISTRFDFRGTNTNIELKDLVVTLTAESEFQLEQLDELFKTHCSKRNVPTSGAESLDKPLHQGKLYSNTITFKQGIEQKDAKDIVKHIKDSKLKVQPSIQEEKIRVTGKKRDDLQDAIALLKKLNISIPLQFENFRD